MAIAAILTALGTAVTVASSIVNLVNDIQTIAGVDNLDDRDLKRLEAALTVLSGTSEVLAEMRKTLDTTPQKTILERSDRPNLVQFLEVLSDGISFQLRQMQAPLQTLELTKQKLTAAQVERMRDGARALVNSLGLDSDDDVEKALERKNLFTLALMVDNVGEFASRDFDADSRTVRDSLSRTGRFTTSVGSYEDRL